MTIGYAGVSADGNEMLQVNQTYVYINAFDDKKRYDDLNMRFCKVRRVKSFQLFSRCDTVSKTAGAGVYVRMRNKESGKVDRKVF